MFAENKAFPLGDMTEYSELIKRLTEVCSSVVNKFLSVQDTTQGFDPANPDLLKASEKFAATMAQRITETMSKDFSATDPFNLSDAFYQFYNQMMTNPQILIEAQADLWQDYANLWSNFMQRAMGMDSEPVVEAPKGDRRFKNEEWEKNFYFAFLKQAYLLTASHMENFVEKVEGLDEKTSQKISFFTKQLIDALSPSNFVLTNPEILQETIKTGGKNLVSGIKNMLDDYDTERGQLAIKMTDMQKFEVGKNIAVTPGQVVYENELFQLIQYSPSTKSVFTTPLLIMPPWINKFYILDLSPENSFVKWCVDQGFTVFLMSWANPDAKLKDYGFEEYMTRGPLEALTAIEKATGQKQVNIIGYCIGGTLLASMLAYMKAKKDTRIASATFFTALIDFSDPGEISVFLDEKQVENIEKKMAEKGYLDGADMKATFNMLRSNDLIWSFVINNYLMGRDPMPFDLLYWNSDSTRLPAKIHGYYLRNMYLKNNLIKKGGITLGGVPIDVRTIDTPSFFISTREDHIAPWKTTYIGASAFSGDTTFCLAGSGHIAGIVNPPAKNKYMHWLSTSKKLPQSADEWFSSAKETAGSWWPAWAKWLSAKSGEQVPITTKGREPGSGALKAIEAAPGRYVKAKA